MEFINKRRFMKKVPIFYSEWLNDRYVLTSSGTTVRTTTQSTDVGDILVYIISWFEVDTSVSSVTDSRGNTWNLAISQYALAAGVQHLIAWSYITNPIQISDTITINWSTGNSFNKTGAFFICKGNTSFGQPNATKFVATVTPSGIDASAQVSPSVICIGVLSIVSSKTYSSSLWNLSDGVHDTGVWRNYYFFKQINGIGGLQNPGGAIAPSGDYGVIWIALR